MTFLIVSLLQLGPAVVAVATHPPTDIENRIAALRGEDMELRGLPKVHAAHVGDVINASLDHNFILIHAVNKWTDPDVQVIVPGVRGAIELKVFKTDDPNRMFESFQFRRHDAHDPSLGEVIVSAAAVGPQTIIAKDFEGDRYQGSIQYVQDAPTAGEAAEDDPVRLLIHRSDEKHPESDRDIKVSAGDFVQLRRQHSAEVDRYLRPILRELDQEPTLFAIEPSVAWQAIGDASDAGPALRGRVEALLQQADADRYQTRQAAIDALKGLGAEVQPLLRQWDRSKLSVQQASVLDSLLAEAAPPTASGPAAGNDVSFLLDVLFNDDLRLKQLALGRLRKLTGQKIELADARDALAVQRLRERLSPTTQPSE